LDKCSAAQKTNTAEQRVNNLALVGNLFGQHITLGLAILGLEVVTIISNNIAALVRADTASVVIIS